MKKFFFDPWFSMLDIMIAGMIYGVTNWLWSL